MTPTSLTDGSTVTWSMSSNPGAAASLTFTTHGGRRTLNISNPVAGSTYVLLSTQDSTGGENLTGGY